MAITNFKFPGVELTQEFVDTPVNGVSALGVAVIGQKYAIADNNSNNPVVKLDPAYTGTLKEVEAADMPADLVEALTGADFDTAYGQYIVIEEGKIYRQNSPITGVTGSSESSAAKAFSFPQVVTSSQGQIGDTIYVTVGENATRYEGIVTDIDGVNVYATFTTAVGGGTSYKVQFASTLGGKSPKATNYISLAAETGIPTITIPVGLTAYAKTADGEYEGTAHNVAEITKFSVWYRARVEIKKNELGIVASYSDIVSQLGVPSVDNPMALACWFALSNSSGNVVYFVPITTGENGVDGTRYTVAMDYLARNAEVYSIVPMLNASDTAQLSELRNCIAMAVKDSEDKESKVRRTIWYGVEVPTAANREALIDAIIDNKKGISSYRAQAVFADGVTWGGRIVPNYIVAAAPAGMRAGQPVHRPISNLGYSVFSCEDTHGFTRSELERIASNGIWVIGNDFYGTPINMRQITTDTSGSLLKLEESMVANIDSIALTLCHLGENMVGCSNISPALITALTDGITTIMTSKTRNNTGSDLIGPQLLSWSLDSIYQDDVLRDHVYATITCEPPRPFNRFVMTLRIV